jgi:hypothetical protein
MQQRLLDSGDQHSSGNTSKEITGGEDVITRSRIRLASAALSVAVGPALAMKKVA